MSGLSKRIYRYMPLLLLLYLAVTCGSMLLLGRRDLLHCTDPFFFAPVVFAGLFCSKRYVILFASITSILYSGIFLTNAIPLVGQYGPTAIALEAGMRIFFLGLAGALSYIYANQQRESKAKLEDTIQQRNMSIRELQLYLQISKNLSSGSQLEPSLGEFLDLCLSFVGAESGSVLLYSRNEDKVILSAKKGSLEHSRAMGGQRKGEGIAGYVAQKGEPFMLVRAVDCPKLKGIRDAICVPLSTKNDVIGVVSMCNRLGGTFSQRELGLLSSIADQAAIYIENAFLFTEIRELSLDVITTLVQAIEAKDRYTRGHSVRVTELALQVGQELGLSNDAIELLQTSGLLHDVGKIGVPESILNKPAKLSEDEYEQVKQHPAIGAAILKPLKDLEEVTKIVYHHHERYDGQGYLEGLKGEDIPLPSRILAVCDTFAAMTSDRPHRKALSEEQAVTELEKAAGSQLDPDIVRILLRVLQKKSISLDKLKVGV